jgi:hypothetical protein
MAGPEAGLTAHPAESASIPKQMDFHTAFLSAYRSSRRSLTLCRRLPLTQDKQSSSAR